MARVKVADLSHWEKGIQIKNLKKAGYEAVICKASQRNEDTSFEDFYTQAVQELMLFGAYHYLDLDYNIITQAELFLTVTEGKQIQFPLVVDLEAKGTNPAAKAKSFIDLLTQAGRKVMLYTSPGYWKYSVGSPAWGAIYPLWIAHYTWPIPIVPSPWKTWTLWQQNATSQIPEHTIAFDHNEFNGDLGQLLAWLETNKPPKPIEQILAEHMDLLWNHELRIKAMETQLQGVNHGR